MKINEIQCCGEPVEWVRAEDYIENAYPSSSILICHTCQRKSKYPCYSTLGSKHTLEMLIDGWNEE